MSRDCVGLHLTCMTVCIPFIHNEGRLIILVLPTLSAINIRLCLLSTSFTSDNRRPHKHYYTEKCIFLIIMFSRINGK